MSDCTFSDVAVHMSNILIFYSNTAGGGAPGISKAFFVFILGLDFYFTSLQLLFSAVWLP